MEIKRVLIAGSRSFTNYEKLKKHIDFYVSKIKTNYQIIIISGGAKGTDLLGEQYAEENGFKIEKYLPDWKSYGKSAGIKINKIMVETSDYIICFWDGISKGTKSTIDYARQFNKPLRVKKV